MNLRTALDNIHRDPFWWRKVLVGGALSLSIVGIPWTAGMIIESMDNVRRGFATPLPPWTNWGNRYVIGFLALLIDFVFFILPVVVFGVVLLCGLLAWTLNNAAAPAGLVNAIVALVVLLYELAMFGIGVAPVGRLLYIRTAGLDEPLSRATLGEALGSFASAEYRRARLRSLPAYVPALLLAVITPLPALYGLPGATFLVLAGAWLTLSAVCYAHLVVAQLYGAVERAFGYR